MEREPRGVLLIGLMAGSLDAAWAHSRRETRSSRSPDLAIGAYIQLVRYNQLKRKLTYRLIMTLTLRTLMTSEPTHVVKGVIDDEDLSRMEVLASEPVKSGTKAVKALQEHWRCRNGSDESRWRRSRNAKTTDAEERVEAANSMIFRTPAIWVVMDSRANLKLTCQALRTTSIT